MSRRRKKSWQLAGIVLLMLILASSAYAFTAANVVSSSRAGDGSGAIGAYTISNVFYTLDNTSPQNIQNWQFDLNAAATTVDSKLVSGSTTYTQCVHGTGFHWTCSPGTEPTVASADQLRVIAVQ
ncbi:MAG: hypothetical protein ABSC51_09415 [Gaiellaceae bacterium]|jgi:hypothetical protein